MPEAIESSSQTTGDKSELNGTCCSIYELIDATDDETYYPLGVYLSLEDAIADAKKGDEPPTECEDYAKLEVRERSIGFTGWGNSGKQVATIEWTQYLHEEKDEWLWHRPVVS